jgi:hypothetical protein
MKSRIVSNFLLAIIILGAFSLAGCRQISPAASQSGIIGKWQNADGTYFVEFLPSGDCSARTSAIGHTTLGGHCLYTVDTDEITIHYQSMKATSPADAPDSSAKWRYTLSGDTLTVSYFATTMTLHRVH